MTPETAIEEYARRLTEVALRKAQPGRTVEELEALPLDKIGDMMAEEMVYSLNMNVMLRALKDQIDRGEGLMPYYDPSGAGLRSPA